MCGLVGMAGALTTGHKDVMKNLLYLDTLRGRDSTGLFSVSRGRMYQLKKVAVPGFDFLQLPFVDTLMAHNDQLWMGHNRLKTTGEINRLNAHPFIVYDEDEKCTLVGAHNGTLKNKWEIERELNNERFGTDSEALFNLIYKEGLKDALAKAEGAWALTFWDAPENTINFVRNKERPLCYAFLEGKKVIVWASEAWMIRAAVSRNNYSLEEDKIMLFSEDTHYVLEIPQTSTDSFGEFIREGGVQGKPERKFLHGWPAERRHLYEDLDDELPPFNSKTKETPSQTGKKSEESTEGKALNRPTLEIVGGKNTKTGFEGEVLTQQQYDDIVNLGCSWCRKPVVQKNAVGFLDSKACVCFSCLRGSKDTEKQDSYEKKITAVVKQAAERMKA